MSFPVKFALKDSTSKISIECEGKVEYTDVRRCICASFNASHFIFEGHDSSSNIALFNLWVNFAHWLNYYPVDKC